MHSMKLLIMQVPAAIRYFLFIPNTFFSILFMNTPQFLFFP